MGLLPEDDEEFGVDDTEEAEEEVGTRWGFVAKDDDAANGNGDAVLGSEP